MTQEHALVLAVTALSCLLLGAWLSSRLHRYWEARRGRRAQLRGERGERAAERLLRRLGYRVLERQAARRYTLTLDGRPLEVELRVDLVLERDGQTHVAEVKTGEQAPHVALPETRRQLLEYQLATGASEVLLVDPERREVTQVAFPLPGSEMPAPRSGLGTAAAWLVVLLTGALLWWTRS